MLLFLKVKSLWWTWVGHVQSSTVT